MPYAPATPSECPPYGNRAMSHAHVFDQTDDAAKLMACLLYGGGLRLLECAHLRVKDVDFDGHQIVVRSGKGGGDRVTLLPEALAEPLREQLRAVRRLNRRDLEAGAGWVELPGALAREYPRAGRDWAWQWVFPATRTYTEHLTGQRRRHHLHESVLQRAVRDAVRSPADLLLGAPCSLFTPDQGPPRPRRYTAPPRRLTPPRRNR